jgi:hypothetical protein
MDAAFGQGSWSAVSHDFTGGTLTVTGIRAQVPPAAAVYLKTKADASARTQDAFEAKTARERADAERAQKANAALAERRDAGPPPSGDGPPAPMPTGLAAQEGAQAPAGLAAQEGAQAPAGLAMREGAQAPAGLAMQEGAQPPSAGGSDSGEEAAGVPAPEADGTPDSPAAAPAPDSRTPGDSGSAPSGDAEGQASGTVPGAPDASGDAADAAGAPARPASPPPEEDGAQAPGPVGGDLPAMADAPSAESPGITVKSLKISGPAPADVLAGLLRNSGGPLDVFASMEIEDLRLHTGQSAELGSAEILVPSAVLTSLSCRPGGTPEGGNPAPACTLSGIATGGDGGFSFAFRYPETDYRLDFRMEASSCALEGVSLGGEAGLSPAGVRAEKLRAADLELALAARRGFLTLDVSAGHFVSAGLEGAYSARSTDLAGIRAILSGNGADPIWSASADSFSAAGLDLREALSGSGARPGAYFLNEFLSEDGGGLIEALWPGWDCLFSQRYSAGSWRLAGFRGSGTDGERLEFRTAEAAGPLVRGKLSDTSLEITGMELEFPSDAWQPDSRVRIARFLGTNILRGDVRVLKTFDRESSTVRWRLDPLDVRDAGRLSADVSFTGMDDPALAELSEIRLRNIDRAIDAVASRGLGIGAASVSLSARPLMDRLVIAVADAGENPPSSAASEITSAVSMRLLAVLPHFASVESVVALTDSLAEYVGRPRALTVALNPPAPLNAASLAGGLDDPASLAGLLNVTVTVNDRLPVTLEH